MKCPVCKYENSNAVKFCDNCGNKISDSNINEGNSSIPDQESKEEQIEKKVEDKINKISMAIETEDEPVVALAEVSPVSSKDEPGIEKSIDDKINKVKIDIESDKVIPIDEKSAADLVEPVPNLEEEPEIVDDTCKEESDEGEIKVELNINTNKEYFVDQRKVIEFQISNISDEIIADLEINTKCESFKELKSKTVAKLFPGRAQKINLMGFQPKRAGEDLLEIGMNYKNSANDQYFYKGEVIINIKDLKDSDNIHIEIKAKKMMGVDASNLVHVGKKYQNDDKYSFSKTPNWQKIELFPVKENIFKSEIQKQSIAIPKTGSLTKINRAIIKILSPCQKDIILLSKDNVCFGRSGSKSDIRLIIEPRNQHNDNLSRRISGRHFCLIYKKGFVFIKDEGSTNGTFVNSTQLLSSKEEILRNGDIIDVAGSLQLSLMTFLPDTSFDYYSGNNDINNEDSIVGASSIIGRLAAVRLKRINNNKNKVYVLLYKEMTVGSNKDNTVIVPGIEQYAFKIVYDNRFYLQNKDSTQLIPLEDNFYIRESIIFNYF